MMSLETFGLMSLRRSFAPFVIFVVPLLASLLLIRD